MLQPIGGMDRIPMAFEARLASLIKRGHEVVEMRSGERGVTVVHKDTRTGAASSVEAHYVICTLPFNILAKIDTDLSPAVTAAVKRVKYDHSLKVAFESPRFWEDQQIYGGISYVKNDTSLIWYPSHGFHAPTGIVLGAYANREAAVRLGDQPLAARIAAARTSIEQVHPGCSQLLTNGINVTWAQIPYSLGPWVLDWELPDGNDPADFNLLNQADGRVYFATANLSQIPGWQEGAALSAHRVIRMLGERAARTGRA